ncbi:MAG: peptidase M48, partial [Bradymonadaceae bacterium]
MARGLRKLEKYNESLVKHLLVPDWGRSEPSLLRTHPHTEKRLERLRELEPPERPKLLDED